MVHDSPDNGSTHEPSVKPYGLYIHIPFCRSKCPYCQFVSETDTSYRIHQYLHDVTEECHARIASSPETVYIGGGTPSLISPDDLYRFLSALPSGNASELTIEANPESVTASWLDAARSGGCNRLSIGVQSLDDGELSRLGRIHTSREAIDAVELARTAGFENISLDLMYSIPGQTVSSFRKTLETVMRFSPQHVSAYALAVEQDTAYAERYGASGSGLPADEEAAAMYHTLHELLVTNGYEWYELSNFAWPGFASRHNKAYWEFTPYIGIGVSAHSYDGAVRSWNVDTTEEYLRRIADGESLFAGTETITAAMHLAEQIMLSLRTARGLDGNVIASIPGPERTGVEKVLDRYTAASLLDRSMDGRYVLTIDGVLLADEIIAELLACLP